MNTSHALLFVKRHNMEMIALSTAMFLGAWLARYASLIYSSVGTSHILYGAFIAMLLCLLNDQKVLNKHLTQQVDSLQKRVDELEETIASLDETNADMCIELELSRVRNIRQPWYMWFFQGWW